MRYRFEVDALTANDAEYHDTHYVFAEDMDEAIQKTRNDYELGGDLVFRLRQFGTTVWEAKGQS